MAEGKSYYCIPNAFCSKGPIYAISKLCCSFSDQMLLGLWIII